MFSGLFRRFEEDCVLTPNPTMEAPQAEIEAYRSRKVALITGISGQVFQKCHNLCINVIETGWLVSC